MLTLNSEYSVDGSKAFWFCLFCCASFCTVPVMNVIEQRQKQIDDAIADAEGKKNDAQAVWHRHRIKLQDADTEAAQRREAYEKQAEKEKEQLLQDASARQTRLLCGRRQSRCRSRTVRRLRDANAETAAWPRICAKSCWRAT